MKGRILSLWLPTAVLVFLFSGGIFMLIDSYNKSVIGYDNNIPIPAYTPTAFRPGERVRNKQEEFDFLREEIESKKGTYSVFIENLNTGTQFTVNAQNILYAASLYKVPVAVAALNYLAETNKTLNDQVMLTFSDFSSGTGSLGKYSAGTMLTYREIIEALLKDSDNTAQTMLLRIIPGPYITKGFTLNNEFVWNPEFIKDNETTAFLYSYYLKTVYTGVFLSDTDKEFMFNTMKDTAFDDRITPHLITGAQFAHKIGNWGDTQNWHDCGIVTYKSQGFVMCVMSSGASFDSFKDVCKSASVYLNSLIL